MTFQSDPKTVWRVGVGHVFSQGGGVGGRGGAFNGTGQLGFNATTAYDLATGLGSLNAVNLLNSWGSIAKLPTSFPCEGGNQHNQG